MYPEAISDILVFKTNIQRDTDLERVGKMLNADVRIRKWNVDRDDVDHVLRIESDQLEVFEAISIISNAGFFCEELPD
jgi:hypothetical protein